MEKRKHILFLSSWYPSKIHSTNGNFVKRHAEAAAKLNNVSVVYAITKNNINSKEIERTQISEHFEEIIIYVPRQKNPIKKYTIFVSAYLEVISTLNRIDLIHLNVMIPLAHVAMRVIKKLRLPYVITEHSTIHLTSDKNNYSFIDKIRIKQVLKNVAYVCPVSNDLDSALKKQYNYQNSKIIRNVVDEFVFHFKEKSPQKIKTLLHVSSYNEEQKNISGLIRVIKELSLTRNDFKFILIGDGDIEFPKKEKEKLSLDNSILEIHGKKTSKEIATYFYQSDLFVLFSNYENSPCVISESLMCGTPVISSDVGGIREMISDKSGHLINARDENELLKSMNNTLDNLNKFDNKLIAENAKSIYSSDVISKQLNEVYNACLKQK